MKKTLLLRIGITLALLLLFGLGALYVGYKNKHDACWQGVLAKVEKTTDLETALKEEIADFQSLVEQSLVARSTILGVLESLRKKKNKPLSGRDLKVLRAGTVDYLELREDLFNVANCYECTIDVGRVYLARHGIDPLLHTKAVLLSLAAALTLNDNWILAVAAFENEARLRRLLNNPDSGFGINAESLASMSRTANSLSVRERVRKAIRFYEKKRKNIAKSETLRKKTENDPGYSYLDLLIQSSPSYTMLGERRAGRFLVRQIDSVGKMSTDFIHELGKDSMDLLSKFFGNTVGLVESRKGKLFGKKKIRDEIARTLKPLDILLEKTPFRLTDKCIPGHFGHVAIWLGTEAELKEIGLWEHPLVKPHHKRLRKKPSTEGALIVEALRTGVQLSSLEHFLNVDDFAVLRPIAITEHPEEEKRLELTREALLLAFRQIGKDYDFNFDINTTEKIVCSELIYVSFPSIDWPTDAVMGRYTISPDNVAKLALGDAPLRLILFYHDGKLVADPENHSENLSVFTHFLKSDEDSQ